METLLALLLVLLSGAHFLRAAGAMMSSSLRVDELGSITGYSARGPLIAATRYELAKNHVFFNIANSLLPGGDSTHPARARFLPVACALAGCLLLLVHFWRAGSPSAGAVAFALPALNPALLVRLLEARGFALIFLMAVTGLLAFSAFLRRGMNRDLLVLAVSTFLGVWTLPFYILFGGCLMALVFFLRPSQRSFVAGMATLVAIVAVYSPILPSVVEVATSYSQDYGVDFDEIEDIFDAMRYAVPPALLAVNALSFLLLVLLTLLAAMIFYPRGCERQTVLLGAAALSLGFYIFCFAKQSPPDRITTFLAAPVAFISGELIRAFFLDRRLALLRPILVLLVGWAGLSFAWRAHGLWEFQPDQRWRDVALVLKSAFPRGTPVFTNGYSSPLKNALEDKRFTVEIARPKREDFDAGCVVLFDSSHQKTHTRWNIGEDYPGRDFLAIRFPLRREREQTLYLSKLPGPAADVFQDDQRLALPALVSPGVKIGVLASKESKEVFLLFSKSVERLRWRVGVGFRVFGNLLIVRAPEREAKMQLTLPEGLPPDISLLAAFFPEPGEARGPSAVR